MLFGAGLAAGETSKNEPVIQFDETGELVEQPEESPEIGPEGQTIIRNKIPAQ